MSERVPNDRLKAWLEERVWDTAENIGSPNSSFQKYGDAEMEAYARGVLEMIESVAEREEVNLFSGDYSAVKWQFEGALGERLRRTNSPRQHLKRRLYNKLIAVFRDKRIAMRDRYESLEYKTEFAVWRKRVWKLEREEKTQEQWDEFNRLNHELTALWNLSHQLIRSDHWCHKNWEQRKLQQQLQQEAA